MWVWFRRKSPAAIAADWDTSANRAAHCCAYLLVEAAQLTVRSQPQWRSEFFHLAMRRGRKIAKVAMARKLAVHLYGMWRQGRDYGQFIPQTGLRHQSAIWLGEPFAAGLDATNYIGANASRPLSVREPHRKALAGFSRLACQSPCHT